MASSSTTTSTRLTLQDTLREYEIRLTGRETLPAAPATDEIARRRRPSLSARPVNPPGWDDRHRDVPPYRPINRNLDLTMRPGGQNLIEAAFIAHLFAGVWLKAVGVFFFFFFFFFLLFFPASRGNRSTDDGGGALGWTELVVAVELHGRADQREAVYRADWGGDVRRRLL